MKFISLDTTASTNVEARKIAQTGDLGPLWIRADEQVSGRGRRGRDWISPKGNLYCTGLYPLQGTPADAARLSFVVALAVYDLASAYILPRELSLKWPNDVLIAGKKCSGILLENGQTNGQAWILIGVGVNLMSHPDRTDFPATHILEHMDAALLEGANPAIPAPDSALAILVAAFEKWRKVYETDGFSPIRQAWLERSANIPGQVTVRLPRETFSGEALGLGANGELQVRCTNGTVRDVHAGDVFFDENK